MPRGDSLEEGRASQEPPPRMERTRGSMASVQLNLSTSRVWREAYPA